MKLVDLHPLWYTWHGRTERIGLSFDCPVHGTAHRVYVPFVNPLDEGKAEQRICLWRRTGETFETLSLTPSVDYTKYDNGDVRDLTCWHGHVANGEVT